ncbi:MFS transporter [Actinoallomurus purpureus]|uniref:MFS transporter n=1 Tax=Actinoallomurus purpureus TaxID=478114 RepID=UPI0020922A0A|nr:MFS transporter [Actinoallomurus purpureus]MCO6007283.1 MFS transporter [Actinoallomurus purpureus]
MSYAADLRLVIRGQDFRRLFATRVVSALADGVFQVALAGYVLFSPEQQATAAEAAATAAVLLLPYSVLGPFAGVFIDRWRRRQILVRAPLIRAVAVAATALLLTRGDDGIPFFLAALMVFAVNRFFLSALSAALPRVVGAPELITANAVSVTSGTMMTFAGAGVGYVLRVLFGAGRSGTAGILFAAAALYVATALIATRMDRDRLGPEMSELRTDTREALGRVLHGLLDGARHVRDRRPAAAALGAIGAHRFLYGIATIMTVLLFRNYFASSAEAGLGGFAVVLVVSGVGYFLAAVITPLVTARIRKEAWIAAQLAFAGVAEVILAAPFSPVPFIMGAFVLGLVSQGVKLCVDTIVQTSIADAFRGRVFSFYDMIFNGLYVAGFALAAALLPANGRSYGVLALIGGGYALAALAYWLSAKDTSEVATAGSNLTP